MCLVNYNSQSRTLRLSFIQRLFKNISQKGKKTQAEINENKNSVGPKVAYGCCKIISFAEIQERQGTKL